MSLPHAVLASTQGLSILIQRLESELGTELQDRTRDASRKFLAYRRSKGQSARDHILYFEQAYQLACDHGLSLSTTMLSTLLVQTAGLSASQEEWVMGCVGGDWSRYAQIRQALRRLPSLDHRHDSEAGVWPVVPAEDKQQVYPASSSWPEHGSSAAGASNEYTPFTSTGLTVPAAEDAYNGNSDTTIAELEIMISLHVNDIHDTSDDVATLLLHTKLEGEFNTMKKQTDSLRHQGLDIHRDIGTKHVHLDQRAYLDQLQPFPPKGRTAKATIVSKEDNTSYRSLVSAIAWAGITSPLANSIASLFQGFLPEVTLEHLEMLNCALAQLLQEYAPLCFRHGFSLREASKLRIIVLADSSLANS